VGKLAKLAKNASNPMKSLRLKALILIDFIFTPNQTF